MNIFIFINYLLIPGVMILFGGLFLKKPPKEINGLYGYRTTMSMKNKDTWDFANKAIGKLWFKLGIELFIITVICVTVMLGVNKELLGKYGLVLFYLQIAVLILSIFPVERKLKENFNKNGTRKKQTKILNWNLYSRHLKKSVYLYRFLLRTINLEVINSE